MKKLKKNVTELIRDARGRIEEIETADLIAMMGNKSVVIVDIRDPKERQRSGVIPGSVHAPRSMVEFVVDPESPSFKDVFGQEGKKYVFHCASGGRSALTVATLQDMGFDASHLREGFISWEKDGGPVERLDE